VVKNRDWWHSAYRVATVAPEAVRRGNALPQRFNLLALSEDWCGDAVNILPFVARFAEGASGRVQLRVMGRDANPDVMAAHLTRGTRAIPIVIALDEDFVEHGWWGPRPLTLQEQAMGDWFTLPRDERRLLIRTFYARDRGRTTLDEILTLLEGVTPPA
jgi:hypothetical protein